MREPRRVEQKLHQRGGEIGGADDTDGVVAAKLVDDGAEVFIVRTHDDGDGKLRGFERIVTTGGDEASADEGDGRERVEGG